MLLHGGHAATNFVWSAADPQEWHYSSPVLTALVLYVSRRSEWQWKLESILCHQIDTVMHCSFYRAAWNADAV